MDKIIPAVSLVIVHIAGDNVGVVPNSAALYGADMYIIILAAYMVFGAAQTGLCAWLGAKTGCELGVIISEIFGCPGKKLLAAAILMVSLPASALTGGYFAGRLVQEITGLPYWASTAICLLTFVLLAAGYCEIVLIYANYGLLLLIPAILALCLLQGWPPVRLWPSFSNVDWPLIFALFSYNAGGMRPLLAAEAAIYLRQSGRNALAFTLAAKMVEGCVTLLIAHLVITAGVSGPLALFNLSGRLLGPGGEIIFAGVLLSVFISTMVPAMIINVRQIAALAGINCDRALIVAGLTVFAAAFIECGVILQIMSVSGLLMAGLVSYIAFLLFTGLRHPRAKRQPTCLDQSNSG